MAKIKNDYIETVYNLQDRPLTTYPSKMTHYLAQRFQFTKDKKLLEVGCGRGEFAKGFMEYGLEVHAVDQSDYVTKLEPKIKFKPCDLENSALPYEDNSFDYIYSKSVIEHFYYPERIMKEIFRILKPGGQVITMTPSWEENMLVFFEDFTHRTPFTPVSLRDLKIITGFKEVHVEKFIQLPIIWKCAWMIPVTKIVSLLAPSFFKKYKFVRFSKEIMLLSHAIKPN